jgi:SAM-dependent methyltransferase
MKNESEMNKLNIGAGTDVRQNYVNHDIFQLDGINVVHDLNVYPWPWKDSTFAEIVASDVIEHLNDFMKAMEEIYRILKPCGMVKLSVPYWNSVSAHGDPTHRRGFHELTFRFFDPDSPLCKERHYYTPVRFNVTKEVFVISPFAPYFQLPGLKLIKIEGKIAKRIIGFLGNTFSNVILDLELELTKA